MDVWTYVAEPALKMPLNRYKYATMCSALKMPYRHKIIVEYLLKIVVWTFWISIWDLNSRKRWKIKKRRSWKCKKRVDANGGRTLTCCAAIINSTEQNVKVIFLRRFHITHRPPYELAISGLKSWSHRQ